MGNPQNLKKRFEQLFRDYAEDSSDSLVREGSVIVDQIINPLSMVLSPMYGEVDDMIEQNNIPSETSTGDVLDAIGERLLVERQEGTVSTAEVHVVLSDRARISIPQGASCYAGDTEFQLVQDVTFAENQLTETTRKGQVVFETPLISVEAAQPGPGSQVAEEKIITPGFTVENIIGIYNPQPSTTAKEGESDDEYRQRIQSSISTRSMDTKSGLDFLLSEEFGDSIKNIEVVGPEDPEMKRDEVYIRRSVSNSQVDISASITRSGGSTSDVTLTINGSTDSLSFNASEANIYAYSASEEQFVHQNHTGNVSLSDQIASIPYGAYVIVFVPASINENDLSAWTDAETRLNLVKLPSDESGYDYLSVSRKGDRSFVPKERELDPSSGDTSVSFSSNIYDYGVNSSGGTDSIGYRNKTADRLTPNASRAFIRQTREIDDPPNEFEREATQEEYNRLSRPDFNAIRVSTETIFSDDFTRAKSLQKSLGNDWICGNTGERWREKDAASGCFVINDNLVLGPREIDPSIVDLSNQDPATSLPVVLTQVSKTQKQSAARVDRLLREEGASSEIRKAVIQEFENAKANPIDGIEGIEGNTSPVVQRKLSQPFGFRINGTVRTTDEEGNPACITIARVENPEQGDTVNRNPALFRWYEGYGLAISPSTGSKDPNIFIIDNASSDRQLTVVGDEYVNGKLNYNVLTQTYMPIDPYTDYQVEITAGAPEIDGEAIPLSARVWEDSDTRPSSPTLSYGAYVPENRREDILVPTEGSFTGTESNPLTSTHVGIGVSRTEGKYAWIFSDFEVENVTQTYAQCISELDARGIEGYVDLRVVARAKGHKQGQGVEYGHNIYVRNVTNQTWELVEDLRYDQMEYWTSNTRINLKEKVNEDGYLQVLITSAYPHEGIDDDPNPATLDIDYIEGGNYNRKEHTGGKSDVFFVQNNPDKNVPTEERTHTITNAQPLNQLSPDDFGGSISKISQVSTGGVSLNEDEYRIFWEDDGLRGSMEETFYIGIFSAVTGTDIDVKAEVHTKTSAVDTFINSSSRRKIDADILAKHKQSIWVDVTLDVKGNFTTAPETLIGRYISGLDDPRITMSGITTFLLANGADQVYTGKSNAEIKKRWIDINGNKREHVNNVLQRDRIETFVPGIMDIQTQ